MQLHRSRPEPRLLTFERCWLSGATGLAQRTGDTRDLFALRSPGSVNPLCPTCASVKANGAARKARERDKRATETRLRNVGANYPFERSRRFPGIRPNSRHGDYFVSCEVGDTQLGLGPRSQQGRKPPSRRLHSKCGRRRPAAESTTDKACGIFDSIFVPATK